MSHDDKLNIILDLDNTLLSAIPSEDFPWEDKEAKNKAINNFDIHNMEHYYIIFERPYLQKFLDFIFDNFNVTIWSAASKNYVLFIVKHIILKKKNRQLKNIFFSYHCSKSKKLYNGGVKKLKMLWEIFNLTDYNKNNTFIIDDLDNVKKIQQANCYHINEFEFFNQDSEKDTELLKLTELLQKILKNNVSLTKYLINQQKS